MLGIHSTAGSGRVPGSRSRNAAVIERTTCRVAHAGTVDFNWKCRLLLCVWDQPRNARWNMPIRIQYFPLNMAHNITDRSVYRGRIWRWGEDFPHENFKRLAVFLFDLLQAYNRGWGRNMTIQCIRNNFISLKPIHSIVTRSSLALG